VTRNWPRTKKGGAIEKEKKDGKVKNGFWRSFLVDLLMALAAVILGKFAKMGLDYLKKILSKKKQ